MKSNTWTGSMVVVGGGRYGQLAVERLGSRVALVVEPKPSVELEQMGIPLWRAEGLAATREMLASPDPPSHVIPTLPIHLLAGWLHLELAGLHPEDTEMPANLLEHLDALKHHAPEATYVSLADFTCPDDCPEPAGMCTVTGEPRGPALYERLRGLDLPGINLGVIQSRQLAPGVGGLKSSDMLELRDAIYRQPGKWLIATACRCHGVSQIITFSKNAL